MSRVAFGGAEVRRRELRRRHLPIITTLLASMLSLFPIVMTAPLVPDIAFLVLISWRLLRPEIWTPTTPLPLGFFNDLVAGHPLGQSMALWTLTFLALDLVDSRVLYRDYWMDWFFASMAIIFYVSGDWFIGQTMGSRISYWVVLPQLIASILTYPIVARVILTVDRWRLSG
jgi:rod shape-determining protein MreD